MDESSVTTRPPKPRQNPHSARGTAATHLPRFRALALFGRRTPQRVEGFVMPASKNLHTKRLMHRSNYYGYSITSARAGSEGGMVRPSAFGPNRFPDEDVLSLVGEQRQTPG